MRMSTMIRRFEGAFAEDDYATINRSFFGQLRQTRALVSDISGWMGTYSRVQELFPPRWPASPDLGVYRVDDSDHIKDKKEPLLNLVSAWEGRGVTYDEVTLCGSATAGSLVTLASLAEIGVRTVVFETPSYYATVQQAKLLGIQTVRVPTYLSEGFHFPFDRARFPAAPLAVWITHPRVSLGMDQDPDHCAALLDSLGPDDYLVIDEATEQHFPGLLSGVVANHPRVIRIRNMFKPLGLNGPRLCVILHPPGLRKQMEVYTVSCSGPLDCFSLELAVQCAANPAEFRMMLGVANEQTTGLYREVEALLDGSRASVTRLANGYIGSAVLELGSHGSYAEKRLALFEYCRAAGMPIMVGSQMSFAFDPAHEFVRINYFNPRDQVITGALLLRDFMECNGSNGNSAKP